MKKAKYLFPNDYMADPSVHVFDGKIYIYPSHDRESGIEENDNGDHFDMADYHVFSLDDVENGEGYDPVHGADDDSGPSHSVSTVAMFEILSES